MKFIAKNRPRLAAACGQLHPMPLCESLERRTFLSGVALAGAANTLQVLQLAPITQPAIHALSRLPNEAATTSPRFSDLWHLQNTGQAISISPYGPDSGTPGADIRAADAWNISTGSREVVVAIFDTGIDLDHPDLAANVWKNPGDPLNGIDDDGNGFVDDIHGWNFLHNNNDVQDIGATAHGTAVAGVIGAVGNNAQGIAGVAWNVFLLPVKLATDAGITSDMVIKGIEYVKGLKARGVNIVAVNASYIALSPPGIEEFSAIGSLGSSGILYVGAAGNNGFNLDVTTFPSLMPPNQLLVAASDIQDNLVDFSSYGKLAVALAAPGADILTTTRFSQGGYLVRSGTSYAAPMVSGAVALLNAAFPAVSMQQVKAALIEGVDRRPSMENRLISGGRLNIYNAMQWLGGSSPPPNPNPNPNPDPNPDPPPSKPPIGSIDRITPTTVAGWAVDLDSPTTTLAIRVAIDGKTTATTTADRARPDLLPVFGSASHGYLFELPSNLAPGFHRIDVYALDSSTSAPTLLGSRTVNTNVMPIGSLDIANETRLAGWAFDPNAASDTAWILFQIDRNAPSIAPANLRRNDLAAALGSADHGFSIALPRLTAGPHTLNVWAIDSTTFAPIGIAQRIINAGGNLRGSIDLAAPDVVAGWAWDPDRSAAGLPTQVRVDVDGVAGTPFNAVLARPDLAALGLVGFAHALPPLSPGQHRIDVYAFDAPEGAPTLLGSRFVTVPASPPGLAAGPPGKPQGSLDAASSTTLAGWAYDPLRPGGQALVRLDINDQPGLLRTASGTRPDLSSLLETNAHGFAATTPRLAPGGYRVTLSVLNPLTLTLTPIATKVITVA